MLSSAWYCYGKSSVCPSVTLTYRDHIGWNFSKIISWLISLGCSLFAAADKNSFLHVRDWPLLYQDEYSYASVDLMYVCSNTGSVSTAARQQGSTS